MVNRRITVPLNRLIRTDYCMFINVPLLQRATFPATVSHRERIEMRTVLPDNIKAPACDSTIVPKLRFNLSAGGRGGG